jgi:hypothetical protein
MQGTKMPGGLQLDGVPVLNRSIEPLERSVLVPAHCIDLRDLRRSVDSELLDQLIERLLRLRGMAHRMMNDGQRP